MANTVIGSSIVIDGEISGDEDLVIQGTVKGKISLQGEPLRRGLGRGGGRHRDPERGDRRPRHREHPASDKVELKADCRVVGDMKAPRILIADGASFKGNVDMDVKER